MIRPESGKGKAPKSQSVRSSSPPLPGDGHSPLTKRSYYKIPKPKITERWLLFKYVGREFTPLWKPLKTKAQAEKARQKYPERERKAIGIGVIRTKR
jgi:hypothetical protein